MTIQELREKRARLWEETKAFLDSHRGEDGLLSAEDDAVYGKMEADITALGKEVARLERQEALDKERSRAVTEPMSAEKMHVLAQNIRRDGNGLFFAALEEEIC